MAKAKCLHCSAKAQYRGLCIKHYQSAARLVRLGSHTWDALEKQGVSAPAATRGRKSRVSIPELAKAKK